jgi:hypothetical protein
MCDNYKPMKKWMCFDKYATCSYHRRFFMPLREGDKVKMTFWAIDVHGRIVCTNDGFTFSFEKYPYKKFRESWIECWQASTLPSAT